MLPSEKLAELGLELPAVATPVAAYVPAVIDRGVVRTSGQIPVVNGEPVCIGAVGEDGADPEDARMRRACAPSTPWPQPPPLRAASTTSRAS